jgi:hypothetical protein
MSFGPTLTSAFQAYGLPDAFSTEQQIAAKTVREAAPIAVEANAQGVLQLDGISTRGMAMLGGPVTCTKQVRVVASTNGTTTTTLTPQEIVDGLLILMDGENTQTIAMPQVIALNQYMNQRLITAEPLIAAATSNSAPRTCFHLRIITNRAVNFFFQNVAQPGHAGSGYSVLITPAIGADLSITTQAINTTHNNVLIAPSVGTTDAAVPRYTQDILFVQTAGTGTDPEWLICSGQVA